MKNKGFALIELLVVIAIIGILSSVLFVTIDIKGSVEDAKITRAKKELSEMARFIHLAKTSNNSGLISITGTGCSDCSCRNGDETSAICINRWRSARQAISDIDDWMSSSIMQYETDPWGISYMLDENEGEGGNCRKDDLRSAGPDMIINTNDDIDYEIDNATAACL